MKKSKGLILFVSGLLVGVLITTAIYSLHSKQSSNERRLPPVSHGDNSEINPAVSRRQETNENRRDNSSNVESIAIPTLADISDAAFEKLNVSCLGFDLSLDPLLMEFANINESEFHEVESYFQQSIKNSLEDDSTKAIVIQDPKKPRVIIPPVSSNAGMQEKILKDLAKIVGEARSHILYKSVARGLKLMTGDFGKLPRVIEFESYTSKEGKKSYYVTMNVYERFDATNSPTDWSKFEIKRGSTCESFRFETLPAHLSSFVEK